MTARPTLPTSRRRTTTLAVVAIFGLVLAACGGGGGGGNGDESGFVLTIAIVNETEGDLSVSLDSIEPGEPVVVASCTARVQTFDIPIDDWQVTYNGESVIDSLEMDPNLLDRNLIARIDAKPDGTFNQHTLAVGRNIGAPAAAGLCL